MKLNKKFLACFMAATMAIAPMTAFGDTASSQIDINGTLTVPDTEQYHVILPTSENLEFQVDPYGILDLEDGTKLNGVLDKAASGEAGSVTSTATAIINKSSANINVKLSSYLTVSGVKINLAEKREEAVSGTKDLYLAIAQVKGATVSITSAGTIVSASTASMGLTGDSALYDGIYAASGNAISVSGGTLELTPTAIVATSSNAMTVRPVELKNMASAYELSGTSFVLSEGAVDINDNNTFAFAITGYANPNSDVWETLKESGENLKLTMKFDISAGEEAGPLTLSSGSAATGVTLSYTGETALNTKYMKIGGVDVTGFGSYASVVFSGNTVTIPAKSFTAAGVSGSCTVELKDTAGETYTVNVQ